MNGDMNLTPFKELLLRTCGHSFEKEREQALSVSLFRRMAVQGMAGYDAYHALLLRDSDELLRLTELLTVNETYFFREPDHLNMMADTLLPEFMALRKQRPIRIVSAGCSTGEEPYSIAIMLRERFGAASERLFEVVGVDIDSTVIASAQRGVYGKNSFRGMDKSLLERYFEAGSSGRYQVCDAIRKQVGFEVVNLLGPSYPERMQLPDIILYRNVSIYFPGQVQREIFGRLAELLAAEGALLVGAAETFHHDIGVLSLVKQDSLFYYRKTPPLVFEERRTASRFSTTSKRLEAGAVRTGSAAVAKPQPPPMRPQATNAPDSPAKRPYSLPRVDIRERFDEAITLAHSKQYDTALDVLAAIIEQDGTFEKAYVLKGSLLLSLSRFDEALVVCKTVLERDPLCLEAYLMLGIIARQMRNNDEAIKRFREAIYLDATCWLAHFHTGEILYAQGDEKRSRSSFETTLKILAGGPLKELGQAFFPLSFNAEQFAVICRHKLSLLVPAKG
ncbi:MAG: tetratricopeptide repeat protein [Desulfuromonadaceae bacterium]|nr:tetratricopeptide repeat protein [Desulfuromonadaceae bacterium]MDD2848703.1 tetratricopeptide repeat protein [Desulfuromonadaceae bacterium]MDD4130794.1 tetratricopeptide repeat protein [Desulfuromonadaceae bacterium]